MKRILTAAAATLLMTASAFADSSALDVRNQMTEAAADDPTVVDILTDDQGMDREDEDYMMRMEAATPDQKKILGAACSGVDLEQAGISDKIRQRCEEVAENM